MPIPRACPRAPWTSVFKSRALGHADVTFALTNGGQDAGLLPEPGHKHRHYRIHTVRDQDKAVDDTRGTYVFQE